MNKGISNFQIDDFFKNEKNEHLKKNYVGTYSIGSVTKYIIFYELLKEEVVNTHLQYLTETKKWTWCTLVQFYRYSSQK